MLFLIGILKPQRPIAKSRQKPSLEQNDVVSVEDSLNGFNGAEMVPTVETVTTVINDVLEVKENGERENDFVNSTSLSDRKY